MVSVMVVVEAVAELMALLDGQTRGPVVEVQGIGHDGALFAAVLADASKSTG